MGRSKKANQSSSSKLFCYWCDKQFDRDEVLIQHQVAKHFRCPHCRTGNAGQCITLESLVMHFRKLHRAELLTVPNAKQGRNDPIATQHIYGMDNVPEDVLKEWYSNTAAPTFATTRPELLQPQLPEQPVPVLPAEPSGLQEIPMEEPASADWSQQVKEWMNAQQKPPEEEAPPPLPELPDLQQENLPKDTDHHGPGTTLSLPQQPDLATVPAPFQGFSLGGARGPQVDPSASKSIAAFAERAKLSVAAVGLAPAPEASIQQPPELFPPQPVAISESSQTQLQRLSRRSRSRSRRSRSWNRSGNPKGRRSRSWNRRGRSQSRGRRDDRLRDDRPRDGRQRDDRPRDDRPRESRPSWRPPPMDSRASQGSGGGGGEGSSMENRTIHIVEGAIRSRLQLKNEMERFGRVETVYMGNRHDPAAEPPLVRFQTTASASAALDAINAGQVLFDGLPVKAELKKGGRRPMQRDIEREVDSKLHITSRDFARDDRRRPNRW